LKYSTSGLSNGCPEVLLQRLEVRMRNRYAGFTILEVMVVVFIVAMLAAVAVPMLQGRANSAKWSEGKAGAGTVMTALRTYVADSGVHAKAAPDLVADLGFTATDLKGTYFQQGNYVVSDVTYDPANGLSATITVNAPTDITPSQKVLTIVNNVATWTEN
jgi:prepilin-type N-terminal cleavage/methylation domain-containing protein